MLIRFDITVPDDLEEPLIGLADRLGLNVFSSPQIIDSEGGEEEFNFSGETIVTFLVSNIEQDPDYIASEIKKFLSSFGLEKQAKIELSRYSDNQDWMENFRNHFQPIKIADNIIIRPPWAQPLDDEESFVTILIDPGMAFGTGTHETTRLCLKMLSKMNTENGRFLDIGAGSGILAFYLAKRNSKSVIAIEIDGAAVENMRKNAALNKLENKIDIRCGDLASFAPPWPADGITANITSPLLIEYANLMAEWLKPGGWGIFSGVNDTNAPALRALLNTRPWALENELSEADWHSFLCRRL